MSVRNLDKFFKPRSVVLIGATPRPRSVGAVVVRNLRRAGFAGELMLVNPHHQAIDGLTVHRNVASVDDHSLPRLAQHDPTDRGGQDRTHCDDRARRMAAEYPGSVSDTRTRRSGSVIQSSSAKTPCAGFAVVAFAQHREQVGHRFKGSRGSSRQALR